MRGRHRDPAAGYRSAIRARKFHSRLDAPGFGGLSRPRAQPDRLEPARSDGPLAVRARPGMASGYGVDSSGDRQPGRAGRAWRLAAGGHRTRRVAGLLVRLRAAVQIGPRKARAVARAELIRRVATACFAAAALNVIALAITGHYDLHLQIRTLRLQASTLFKPLLYLNGAFLICLA